MMVREFKVLKHLVSSIVCGTRNLYIWVPGPSRYVSLPHLAVSAEHDRQKVPSVQSGCGWGGIAPATMQPQFIQVM